MYICRLIKWITYDNDSDSLKNVLRYVVEKLMNDHRSNFKSYVTPPTADKYLAGQEFSSATPCSDIRNIP